MSINGIKLILIFFSFAITFSFLFLFSSLFLMDKKMQALSCKIDQQHELILQLKSQNAKLMILEKSHIAISNSTSMEYIYISIGLACTLILCTIIVSTLLSSQQNSFEELVTNVNNIQINNADRMSESVQHFGENINDLNATLTFVGKQTQTNNVMLKDFMDTVPTLSKNIVDLNENLTSNLLDVSSNVTSEIISSNISPEIVSIVPAIISS